MSRTFTDYAERRPTTTRAAGYDVSTPTAGYYRMRLTSGGVYGAVRIWYGQPPDPVTGELLDRSLRWQATFNNEPIDLDRVWPVCGREPISSDEAARLIQQAEWAKRAAPDSAYANPRARIDRLSRNTPLPF